MTLPLILLAIASVVAGYWTGLFQFLTPKADDISLVEIWTNPWTWFGELIPLIGFGWAWWLYGTHSVAAIDRFVQGNAVLRFLYNLTLHKFYVDDLYYWLTKYVFLGICSVAAAFDRYIVDGLVNGVASLVMDLGQGLRHSESGKVQTYMYGFFGGVALLAVLIFVLVAFEQAGVKLW
jgi:NADH:ubiquinone oxidoreductase subunit 5 (subunit L)/multisubunit Na+/H+ antiporter MnhA subunit